MEYLRAAREVARLYHEKGAVEEAKTAIEEAINRHPASVEPGDLNLLLELHLVLGNYEEALEVHCTIVCAVTKIMFFNDHQFYRSFASTVVPSLLLTGT